MTNSTHRALISFVSLAAAFAFSMASPALAVGVDPEEASLVQREQAQSLFKKGRQFYQRERYEEALAEFRASHDIVASPNTRLLIARCLRDTGRIVEAYVEFGRTAIEAKEMMDSDPRYRRAARSADAEREALAGDLGFVQLEIVNDGPQTTVWVSGEKIKRAAWSEPVPVMPGEVTISVKTPGYLPANQEITLEAGEPVEVTIDARANPRPEGTGGSAQASASLGAPEGKKNLRPYAYVAGGVGAAGLATFTIAGLMARSDYNELEESCGGPCPPERQDDIDSGRAKQSVANVGLVVGVVGLAAGVTLYLMSQEEPGDAEAGLVLSPGWLGVQGRM